MVAAAEKMMEPGHTYATYSSEGNFRVYLRPVQQRYRVGYYCMEGARGWVRTNKENFLSRMEVVTPV